MIDKAAQLLWSISIAFYRFSRGHTDVIPSFSFPQRNRITHERNSQVNYRDFNRNTPVRAVLLYRSRLLRKLRVLEREKLFIEYKHG